LEVKLTDFGIGQVVSQEALAGMTQMVSPQTMLSPGSSSQTGTHLYMAPGFSLASRLNRLGHLFARSRFVQLLIGDFTAAHHGLDQAD